MATEVLVDTTFDKLAALVDVAAIVRPLRIDGGLESLVGHISSFLFVSNIYTVSDIMATIIRHWQLIVEHAFDDELVVSVRRLFDADTLFDKEVLGHVLEWVPMTRTLQYQALECLEKENDFRAIFDFTSIDVIVFIQ
jgi:hypothetical protein